MTALSDKVADASAKLLIAKEVIAGEANVPPLSLDQALQDLRNNFGGGSLTQVNRAVLEALVIMSARLAPLTNVSEIVAALNVAEAKLDLADAVIAGQDVDPPVDLEEALAAAADEVAEKALDQLGTDDGASKIGNGGESVKDSLDALQLPDYAALRAYKGPRKSVYVTGVLGTVAPSGIAGMFVRDDGDTTSADNSGTIIVANGKRWKRAFDGVAAACWFGTKGDGVTNDTVAIQHAIEACAGGRLHFTPGLYLSDNINLSGMSIKITFDKGCEFIAVSTRILSCFNDYTNILNVSSITTGVLTVEGSSVTTVSILNFAAPPVGYAKGDVIKVVSDDTDPNTDTAAQFMGEYAIVALVSGNTIYLYGPLEDPYATNIRIGKLTKHQIDVQGMVITNNGTATGSLIQLEGCYRPVLSVHIKRHPGIGINAIGCYYGKFVDCTAEQLRNASGYLGYMINDSGGLGNEILRPRASLCRHVTTTNMSDITAGVTPMTRYGATRDHTVIDGKCEANEGAAWDSHSGSRRSKWINCSADSVVQGYNTSPAAFSVRGVDEEIINGESSPRVGVFAQVLPTARRLVITNPRSFSPQLIRSTGDGTGDELTIVGGFAQSKNGLYIISSDGRNVLVRGTKLTHRIAANARQCFDMSSGTLRIDGARLQVSGTGGETSYRIVRSSAGTVDVIGKFHLDYSAMAAPSVLRQEAGVIGGRFIVESSGQLGPLNGAVSGTHSYVIRRADTGAVGTNITDFTDYLAKLATI